MFVTALLIGSSNLLASPSRIQANPAAKPERKLVRNAIVSDRDPKIKIEVPRSARYVGADRWNMFDVADCEIHLFVEADKNKQVKNYYWIQFEGFLPSISDRVYQYKGGENRVISGLDFNLRARFGPSSDIPKPDSDLDHILKLLTSKGYTLPADLMNVRFVHLLDETKRRELMVIYGEDLRPTGFTSTDFIADNKINDRWAPIEKTLIERACKKIKFTP